MAGRESFHGRLRDELLDREAFVSLAEARVRLEGHRLWYNQERPHSALGYETPASFKEEWERRHRQINQAGEECGESTKNRE